MAFLFSKYKLLQNLVVPLPLEERVEMNVLDILHVVSAIHLDACSKYPAYGWEQHLTTECDATPVCNLDAILRHTLQLAVGESIDTESTFPHIWHICCRLQMYFTSLYRTRIDEKGCIQRSVYILSQDLKDKTIKPLYPWTSDFSMLTPEFIYLCMMILESKDIGVLSFNDILIKYINAAKQGFYNLVRCLFIELISILPHMPKNLLVTSGLGVTELRSAVSLGRNIFALFFIMYSPLFEHKRQVEHWKSLVVGYNKTNKTEHSIQSGN